MNAPTTQNILDMLDAIKDGCLQTEAALRTVRQDIARTKRAIRNGGIEFPRTPAQDNQRLENKRRDFSDRNVVEFPKDLSDEG